VKIILLALFFVISGFILINPVYADLLTLHPTDDAFVIVNPDDPDDLDKLQTVNTGNDSFLEIWSPHIISPGENNLESIIYLKFDLRDFDESDIGIASLRIFPKILNFEITEEIELFYSPNNNWNESEITYMNRPSLDTKSIITIEVTPIQTWQLFDITELIKKNMDSEMTLALKFKGKQSNQERSLAYHSKESLDASIMPRLDITFNIIEKISIASRIVELENKVLKLEQQNESGGCLIATATYGTELAPQVQQLRELRDNTLLQTNSGKLFMNSFNQFYYSFSPVIADMERENPLFKEAVKIGITPLLSSLSIMSHADSELKVLGYGIGVILMNMGMYFVAPTLIIMKIFSCHKHKKN